ncbi:MAG: BspA family leucine-rich repeat surface protein [Bacteroidota bacterium]
MNRRLHLFFTFCIFCLSCSEDATMDEIDDMVVPEPVLQVADLTLSIDENLDSGSLLGVFMTTRENLAETVIFSITEVSASGSVQIDNDGRLTIADETAFDFEARSSIAGTIRATAGNVSDSAQFTITINDVNEPIVFISQWNLPDDNLTVQLPIYEGNSEDGTDYNFSVDWGDGTITEVTSFDDEDAMHTYGDSGIKTVTISGFITGFNFGQTQDSRDLFYDVLQWGGLNLGNAERHFELCRNLIGFTATDSPNLRAMTSMEFMFSSALMFNGDISHWDVSNIIDMTGVFVIASSFDQDISNWDVSKVTLMRGMFADAAAFNQDISGWDVRNVTDMEAMFASTTVFNQDISSWDVGRVTEFRAMFRDAVAFNQDISTWDMDSALDLGLMFSGASSFNQNLSTWNVSNVIQMDWMFQDAESFNQDISNWDVGQVTDMREMFGNAVVFNQDLSNWDTTNVTVCNDFSTGSALEMEHLPILGCFAP